MTLEGDARRGEHKKLALAFALNILFLALILSCFAVRFETNDDLLMSKFVDGQMAHKTAYVPFLNILLGMVLKLLYTLGGNGISWWSICEYGAALLGFTAISWVMLKKLRLYPALTICAALLCVFGADTYLSMNFSKAAAAATVGGLTLMLYAMKNESGRVLKYPLTLGMLLGIYGFMWRFEEFFACAAVIAGLGLHELIAIGQERGELSAGKTAGKMLRYALPFIIILAIIACLFGANYLAWTSEEYRDYSAFDWTRSMLIDFVVPEYEQMPEVYDALEMDENAIELFNDWAFYDTEKFTTQSMQAVIDARAELVQYPSAGECLGIFLDKCLLGFCQDRPFAGFIFMLVLFLACGKRRARDWVAVIWFALSFLALYLFFIRSGRYLANRVDIGLFLAIYVGLAMLLDPERLKEERILCAVALLVLCFSAYRSCRGVCRLDSHSAIEDKSGEKAAVERILEDEEHLFFVKYLSLDHILYSPFEAPPEGYADKIVFIGGWSCRHPEIERVLAQYGITNPYRDIIGSDSIYIIDRDIGTTMAYINKYYSPEASAELVEPLSTETGYKIYRILA